MATDQLDILGAKYSERDRIKSIQELSRQPFMGSNGDLWAERMIRDGASIEQARQSANKMAQDYSASNQKPIGKALGLSTREVNNFSICKALSTPVFELDGLERECHNSLLQKLPANQREQVRGCLIPVNDLKWGTPRRGDRAIQSVGGNGGSYGGNLVATNLDSQNFISVLENRTMVMALGATMLPGQVGNLSIPKQLTSNNTYWLSENEEITLSAMSFGNVNFEPKTLASLTSYTRQMLLSATPEIETLVRADLLRTLSIELDRAAIAGAGGLEPLGILNQPGVTDLGSDGADGDELTWSLLTEMEATIAENNADSGNLAYLTTSRIRKAAKNVTQNSSNVSQWLWEADPLGRPAMGMMNGYPVAISENVPSDGAKGGASNLNGILFGNFSDLMIANWGSLEILTNPFTNFRNGSVEARAMLTVDINVRRGESFCYTREIIPG